ncbi:MAG TPA: hypothetical protein VHL52_03965 [Acidimicrobiia bacterium]|jgi:hypothetical protein|nr:hypothetical protein [Acidimicrobiia bacterium]
MEPVRIPVGYDLFRAQVIEAACTDAGFDVRLIRNEHPETGSLVALQPSYLLVRPDDVSAVRRIVEETYPQGADDIG